MCIWLCVGSWQSDLLNSFTWCSTCFVLFCPGAVETWLHWLIDWLIFGCVNAGSARVKPMSPVTVTPGRCGWRKLLKWNQRNVSTDLVSLSPTWTGIWNIFWCKLIKQNVAVQWPSLIFTLLSSCPPCSPASGWCEWGLRGRCQLSVVALQRQTLRQLQVSHTEKWGLQPHAVCKGNFTYYHLSRNSITLEEFVLFYAGLFSCLQASHILKRIPKK